MTTAVFFVDRNGFDLAREGGVIDRAAADQIFQRVASLDYLAARAVDRQIKRAEPVERFEILSQDRVGLRRVEPPDFLFERVRTPAVLREKENDRRDHDCRNQ